MNDFLILIGVAVLGFVLGQFVTIYKLRHFLIQLSKENLASISESKLSYKDEIVRKLFVEKIEDILYLYDAEKNDFICQAQSFDELADLAYKYKKITYAVVVDPVSFTVYSFTKGKVVTSNES